MALHLKIDKEAIEGESKAHEHVKWIDIDSWSWGVSNSTSVARGDGSGEGTAMISDMQINKTVDGASNKIFQACCTGKMFGTITLHGTKAIGALNPGTWLKIELTDCIFTSVSESGAEQGGAQESVSIGFKKLSVEVFTQNDGKGPLTSAGIKTYDVAGALGTG
jgi:type VI secretion system secreted protein Hcp